MDFSFNISERSGALLVRLSGKLFQEDDARSLYDQIDLDLQGTTRYVVFDLSELTHCNSSGINVFIRTLTKTRIKLGETYLCALNKALQDLLVTVKMDEIFYVLPSVEEAIESIQSKEN